MKVKSFLVIQLLICLAMMTTVATYFINNKTTELDIPVIVSMAVGGLFVMLGMLRKKHMGEGR